MKVYEVICNYSKENDEIYCLDNRLIIGNIYDTLEKAREELKRNIEFQTTCVIDTDNVWGVKTLDNISEFDNDLHRTDIVGEVVAYYMIGMKCEYKNNEELEKELIEEINNGDIQYVEYIIEREVL